MSEITDDMLDRAAAALYELEGLRLSWADLHVQFQDLFRERARVVVAAAFTTNGERDD